MAREINGVITRRATSSASRRSSAVAVALLVLPSGTAPVTRGWLLVNEPMGEPNLLTYS